MRNQKPGDNVARELLKAVNRVSVERPFKLHKTKYIQQIIEQLNKMSEEQKNQWILSQAKLCKESQRQGLLQSLIGEKKVPYMPAQREIDELCRKVEDEEIYVEYETRYYEFDDDGKYMDDWKSWHNDPFGVMPVLDNILTGCHDLLILGEYGMAADILDRVCRLEFKVVESSDSDEYADMDARPFTLAGAFKEGRLSRELPEIGLDWVRASIGRANEMGDSAPAREVIDILENPICKNVHPHMLPDDELLEGIFSDELLVQMEKILTGEIQKGEKVFQGRYAEARYSPEKVRFRETIIRKKEILLNIQLKCRKGIPEQRENMSFAFQWKRINEVYDLLPYEYGEYRYGIRNRWEADEIQRMCANLLKRNNLGAEDWELRKAVLSDLVTHRFYKKVNCEQMMSELPERLCGRKEEFLAFADILNQSDEYEYKKEAASLYHQYGKEEKYIAFLEADLGKKGKTYAALVDCYQRQGNIDGARKTARLGLEQCRDELTDLFIWLLADARRSGDKENYKKLYASAKRRQGADMKKIDKALESGEAW